jgi:hypothetical protein
MTPDLMQDMEDIDHEISQFTEVDWREAQANDRLLSFWIQHMRREIKAKRKCITKCNKRVPMYRMFSHLSLDDKGIM